jgi:hypothetical protein
VAVLEVSKEPTRRELAVFAALWAAFFPVLGWIVSTAGDGLLVFAGIAAGCFVIAAALNSRLCARERLAGAGAAVAALAIWGAVRASRMSGVDAETVRTVSVAIGAVVGMLGGAVSLASRPAGTRLYRAWMLGMLPIGWTFSHLILGAVFFGVITPIGLLMRVAGRDSMERRKDASMETYWLSRGQRPGASRYLRQF